jgi:hypothetical protein
MKTIEERMKNLESWAMDCEADPEDHEDMLWLFNRLKRLTEALEYYADENNYDEEGRPGKCFQTYIPGQPTEYDFECDFGYIAKKILEE